MKSNTQAFTLIELLVVILIIGILATVALPQYRIAVEKSHATEAITAVRALVDAEHAYYLANGEYTTNLEDLDIVLGNIRSADTTYSDTSNWFITTRFANNKNNPRIYAGRQGQSQQKNNGRWYINYILNSDQLYCTSMTADIQSRKLCKTFGHEEQDCPFAADEKCVAIQ
ncbi:MAG: prepilin-type N-terminal cleavage/methylation domain-containing protein [Elusimicrobiaceae bacterium]|nr:prepilin-type N-terminal cleavage/methylation domain-containing protein [Elusimicrobiaceae bacterium]